MNTKQIEEDAKLRAAKDQEIIAKNKAKRKARALKQQQEESKKYSLAEARHNIISWIDKDKRGLYYEGYIGKKLLFKIAKGATIYTLTVIDKVLIKEKQDQGFKCSPNLQTLKDKAKKLMIKYLDPNLLKVVQKELRNLV